MDFFSSYIFPILIIVISLLIFAYGRWLIQQFQKSKKATISKPTLASTPELDPKTASLLKAIEEQRNVDPYVGAKIAGKEIKTRVMNAIKGLDPKGIHIESLLCILGSLGGYASLQDVFQQIATKTLIPGTFHIATAKNGQTFYFGDPINHGIFELYRAIGPITQSSDMPDINEIFAHVASSIGSENFGIPRLPPEHMPSDKPINSVKSLWNPLFPTLKLLCPTSSEWPLAYGFAIQEIIEEGKQVISPALAVKIVMESAIPMSKVDLRQH